MFCDESFKFIIKTNILQKQTYYQNIYSIKVTKKPDICPQCYLPSDDLIPAILHVLPRDLPAQLRLRDAPS